MPWRDTVSKKHGGQHLRKSPQVVFGLTHALGLIHVHVHTFTYMNIHSPTHHKKTRTMFPSSHKHFCGLWNHYLLFSAVLLAMVCFSSDPPEEMALLAKQGRKSLPCHPTSSPDGQRHLEEHMGAVTALPGPWHTSRDNERFGCAERHSVAVWEGGDLALMLWNSILWAWLGFLSPRN